MQQKIRSVSEVTESIRGWGQAWYLIVLIPDLCFFLTLHSQIMAVLALWLPAGKGLTSWLSCLLCFVTFGNVFSSTSELRVSLEP